MQRQLIDIERCSIRSESSVLGGAKGVARPGRNGFLSSLTALAAASLLSCSAFSFLAVSPVMSSLSLTRNAKAVSTSRFTSLASLSKAAFAALMPFSIPLESAAQSTSLHGAARAAWTGLCPLAFPGLPEAAPEPGIRTQSATTSTASDFVLGILLFPVLLMMNTVYSPAPSARFSWVGWGVGIGGVRGGGGFMAHGAGAMVIAGRSRG